MERVKASMTASQVGIKNVIVVAWHYKRFFNLLTDMLAIINPIWYAGGGAKIPTLSFVLCLQKNWVFKKMAVHPHYYFITTVPKQPALEDSLTSLGKV